MVDTDKTPRTFKEFAAYRSKQERAKAVLDVLWMQPEHEVRDEKGRATSLLMELMPQELKMDRINHHPMSIGTFITILRAIDDAGFIAREINGKKTYAIKVGNPPDDWTPPNVVVVVPAVQGNGQSAEAVIEEEPEPEPEQTLEEEAKEGGIRAGRLASRLERLEEGISRTIPALVEEGVVAGINGWFTQIAVALGYVPQPVETEEVETLNRRVEQIQDKLEEVNQELRQERVSHIASREELNRVLRSQVSTHDSSPVRPNDLQEAYRGLARHAIANGWTLHRAGSGHIMWKSPFGYRYFTGSTSSDWRAVKNSRSDMERLGGLPKE